MVWGCQTSLNSLNRKGYKLKLFPIDQCGRPHFGQNIWVGWGLNLSGSSIHCVTILRKLVPPAVLTVPLLLTRLRHLPEPVKEKPEVVNTPPTHAYLTPNDCFNDHKFSPASFTVRVTNIYSMSFRHDGSNAENTANMRNTAKMACLTSRM